LRRDDRPRDRAAPALRVPRRRRSSRSAQGHAAESRAALGRRAHRFPAPRGAADRRARAARPGAAALRRALTHRRTLARTSHYLGLMSGTSADAIDAALVAFDPAPRLVHALAARYPDALREQILALSQAPQTALTLDEVATLDHAIGAAF